MLSLPLFIGSTVLAESFQGPQILKNTGLATQASLIKVVCEIQTGLNVTKAALITKQVKASNSFVTFTCKNRVATADNIFELLSLGMVQGDFAVISICGEDSEDTLRNIVGLLTSISNPISPDVFNRAA